MNPKFIKKESQQGGEILKKNVKLFGYVILGILVALLICLVNRSLGFGMKFGIIRNFGGANMYMNAGAGMGAAGTIALVLLFLIKILFVIFIAGLVIGLVIVVKRFVFTQEDIQKIKSTFARQKTETVKVTCAVCGKEQNSEWKVCPFCGSENITTNA